MHLHRSKSRRKLIHLALVGTFWLALLVGCERPASVHPGEIPQAVPNAAATFPASTGAADGREPTFPTTVQQDPAGPTPVLTSPGPALEPVQAATGTSGSPTPGSLTREADPLTSTSSPARLVFRLPRQAFPPQLSLNGNTQVFSAALDGSGLTPLTPALGGEVTPLDVSEQGLALTASGADLYAARLDGGDPVRIADNYAGPLGGSTAGAVGAGAYWLPNAAQVVFIGTERGERAIFRVNADGAGLARLTQPGAKPAGLLPAGGSSGVVWRQGTLQDGTQTPLCIPSCYLRTGLAGGAARSLWPGVEIAALALRTGLLAYHAGNQGGWEPVPVFILAPDGSIKDQSEPLNVCSLAWSPDGEQLLIGTLYGENFCGLYLLWRPGGNLEALPEDLPSSYAQHWSPGGRLILFEDYSGAWVYDLVTQNLRPALEQLGLPPGAATNIFWVP